MHIASTITPVRNDSDASHFLMLFSIFFNYAWLLFCHEAIDATVIVFVERQFNAVLH